MKTWYQKGDCLFCLLVLLAIFGGAVYGLVNAGLALSHLR